MHKHCAKTVYRLRMSGGQFPFLPTQPTVRGSSSWKNLQLIALIAQSIDRLSTSGILYFYSLAGTFSTLSTKPTNITTIYIKKELL